MDISELKRSNVAINLKKYLRLFGYRRAFEVGFWLNHRCVYDCKYCVLDNHGGPFMPKKWVFDIIQEALPLKLNYVVMTGGEPMLHRDFIEVCQYSLKHIDTIVNTTGRLITEKVLEELHTSERKCTWSLTLISHKEEVNDSVRARGAFQDVNKAARMMREAGHPLNVHINVVPENLGGLPETVKYAFEELKPEKVTIEAVSPIGCAARNAAEVILNDEQLLHYHHLVSKLMQTYTNLAPLGTCVAVPEKCIAITLLHTFNIHPTGVVSPCCYFTEPDGSLGDAEEGIRRLTSMSRVLKYEKLMLPTHYNVKERVEKVGAWSCVDCVRNFQVKIRGNKEFER